MLIRAGHAPWRRGPRFCPAGPGRGWIGTGTGTGIGVRTGTGSGSAPEPPSAGPGGGGRAVPTGGQRAGLGAPLQRCPGARCAPAVPGGEREWLGCCLQASCCSWKEGEGPRDAAGGTAGGTAGCRARGPHPGAASRAAGCAEPGSGRAGSQPGAAWGSLGGAGEPPAPAGSLWPGTWDTLGQEDAGHAGMMRDTPLLAEACPPHAIAAFVAPRKLVVTFLVEVPPPCRGRRIPGQFRQGLRRRLGGTAGARRRLRGRELPAAPPRKLPGQLQFSFSSVFYLKGSLVPGSRWVPEGVASVPCSAAASRYLPGRA